jgi:hypothetical protein
VDWIHVYFHQLGWPQYLLAECNHVTQITINAVLSGRTWQR